MNKLSWSKAGLFNQIELVKAGLLGIMEQPRVLVTLGMVCSCSLSSRLVFLVLILILVGKFHAASDRWSSSSQADLQFGQFT